MSWLLYGAYGFTGRLIASEAVARGLRPILAGRDRRPLERLASELGLEHRCVGLGEATRLREAVGAVDAVVHAAGPFSATASPMVEACLAAGTHYLDITGEVDVLEAVYGCDERARSAGVLLLPGAGFDVVPTDCAAARAAARVASPVAVDLAFVASGPPSRGTARTMLEGAGRPSRVRRAGVLVDVPMGSVRRRIPFSDRPRDGVAIPWGDLASAARSTGAADVRVFLASRAALGGGLGRLTPLLATRPGRWLAERLVARRCKGPDARELAHGGARIWCEVHGAGGESASVELITPNGYALTSDAAVSAVQRLLLAARPPTGARTPSGAFGADFVATLRGVRWVA